MDYEKLYKAYYMQVYSFVMTLVRDQPAAEEITQNTFFKAMTAKKQFAGRSDELTYLCSIAKNLAADEFRRNSRHGGLDESLPDMGRDFASETEDKDDALYINKILHELLVVLSDKKGLIVMAWDTVWLFLTIIVVNVHYQTIQAMYEGCTVAAIMAAWAWGGFLIARYLPANRWIKGGIITIISAFACVLSNDIWIMVTQGRFGLTVLKADFSVWTTNEAINANAYAITLAVGAAAAAVMIIAGIARKKKKRKSWESF